MRMMEGLVKCLPIHHTHTHIYAYMRAEMAAVDSCDN